MQMFACKGGLQESCFENRSTDRMSPRELKMPINPNGRATALLFFPNSLGFCIDESLLE